MKSRLVFALIFGGLVATAFWLIAGTSSPWSEDLTDSILDWLLRPLYLVPYIVLIILRPERELEEFIATFIVFLEGFVIGFPLYSLFSYFFRKSEVADVSISSDKD